MAYREYQGKRGSGVFLEIACFRVFLPLAKKITLYQRSPKLMIFHEETVEEISVFVRPRIFGSEWNLAKRIKHFREENKIRRKKMS